MQRVGIAQAIAQPPAPADPRRADVRSRPDRPACHARELVRALHAAGTTIIFSSAHPPRRGSAVRSRRHSRRRTPARDRRRGHRRRRGLPTSSWARCPPTPWRRSSASRAELRWPAGGGWRLRLPDPPPSARRSIWCAPPAAPSRVSSPRIRRSRSASSPTSVPPPLLNEQERDDDQGGRPTRSEPGFAPRRRGCLAVRARNSETPICAITASSANSRSGGLSIPGSPAFLGQKPDHRSRNLAAAVPRVSSSQPFPYPNSLSNGFAFTTPTSVRDNPR